MKLPPKLRHADIATAGIAAVLHYGSFRSYTALVLAARSHRREHPEVSRAHSRAMAECARRAYRSMHHAIYESGMRNAA